MSINWWLDKHNMLYATTAYGLAIKMKWAGEVVQVVVSV
jgi:hypothetical protein